MPPQAPGNRHEATTNMMRMMKSIGMSNFEARSMPPLTPMATIWWVMRINNTAATAGLNKLVENVVKYSTTYSLLPCSCSVNEA